MSADSPGGMPAVQAALIAKDAAATLPQALTSLRGLCDRIVLLDTGSTDGTPEVAAGLGAEVHRAPWTGFSAARNQVLDLCHGGWVLVLDADEALDAASRLGLRVLLEADDVDAYYVNQINYRGGRPPIRTPVVRLFRNKPAFRFEGVLHERLRGPFVPRRSPVIVHHWGAHLAEPARRAKEAFYAEMLEAHLREHPDDAEPLIHLATLRYARADYRGALALLERALACVRGDEAFCPVLDEALASTHLRLAQPDEAAVACLRGLSRQAAFPPLYYDLAVARFEQRRFTEAREAARQAIDAARRYDGLLPLDPEIATTLGPQLLARIARGG